METFKELLFRVNLKIEEPLVDARFGDSWQEHQKQLFKDDLIDVDDFIGIAWKQGRRAILLERELQKLIQQNERLSAAYDSLQKDDNADDGDL